MDTQKKIMILGGGYYQLPLIKKSVELGYYTIVCGIAGNYPGYKYATKWYDVDTFDKESCLKIAQQEKIDGIVLCGTDAMMTTLGFIVDQLKLKGPSEKSCIYSTNKALMKERFLQYNVRTANYRRISSIDSAIDFAQEYSFPVVLKVVDGCGGKGIAIIKDISELSKTFPILQRETNKNYLIIEQYICGEEFGAQAFVSNGELEFIMPHGDMVYHSATDIPIGHYAPYEKTGIVKKDVKEQLLRSINALGIDNTAINADFILSKGKVYVLEIGARAGATCLPELVSLFYGQDYYEYLLRKCVGENTSFFKFSENNPSLVETLISAKSGVLKRINHKVLPKEIVSLNIYLKEGDKVSSFKTAYDRIGTFTMKGDSIKHLMETSKSVKDDLIIIENEQYYE